MELFCQKPIYDSVYTYNGNIHVYSLLIESYHSLEQHKLCRYNKLIDGLATKYIRLIVLNQYLFTEIIGKRNIRVRKKEVRMTNLEHDGASSRLTITTRAFHCIEFYSSF